MAKKEQALESKIQASIIQWLKENKHMVFRMLEVTPNGTPDLLIITMHGNVWLEIKQPGGRLSPAQEMIHYKLRLNNQKVFTVSSLEMVKQIMKDL